MGSEVLIHQNCPACFSKDRPFWKKEKEYVVNIIKDDEKIDKRLKYILSRIQYMTYYESNDLSKIYKHGDCYLSTYFSETIKSISEIIFFKKCSDCGSEFENRVLQAEPLDEFTFWKTFKERPHDSNFSSDVTWSPFRAYLNAEWDNGDKDVDEDELYYSKFKERFFNDEQFYETYLKICQRQFILNQSLVSYSLDLKIFTMELALSENEQLKQFEDRVSSLFLELTRSILSSSKISATILCRSIAELIIMLYSGDTSKFLTKSDQKKTDELFNLDVVSKFDQKMISQILTFGNRAAHDASYLDLDIILTQAAFLKAFIKKLWEQDIFFEHKLDEQMLERLKKLKWQPIHREE